MSVEPLQAPESPPAPSDERLINEVETVSTPPEPGADPELSASVDELPSRRGRRPDQRLKARQVMRVVRRVEPWSVLKVASVLYLCLWLVLTVAGVILWQLARATGTLDNLEDFIATALADTSFTIDGRRVLFSSLTGGAVLVFAGTGLTVLLTVLFNLVSELTGGLRMSVVELETAVPVDEEVG